MRGEEIVKIDISPSVVKVLGKVLDNLRSKTILSMIFFPGIYIQPTEETIGAVCHYLNLHTPFDGFLWHVLLQARASLKLYHGFVHC